MRSERRVLNDDDDEVEFDQTTNYSFSNRNSNVCVVLCVLLAILRRFALTSLSMIHYIFSALAACVS